MVGLTGTGGLWQFSRDDGTTGTNFGTVSAPRVLAATDMVRFTQPASFTGNAALQLRAWDSSTDSAGAVVILSTTGKTGASAHSATILKRRNRTPGQDFGTLQLGRGPRRILSENVVDSGPGMSN